MSTVEQISPPPRGPQRLDYGRAPSGPGQEEQKPLDVPAILRMFWRQKGLIAGTLVLVLVLAVLLIWQITPTFTATSTVMIGGRESQVVDIEAVMAGLSTDVETIESEIQVLRSRGLAQKVVEDLRLELDPEFNASLSGPSGLRGLIDLRALLPEEWASLLLGDAETSTADPVEAREAQLTEVIERVLDRVSVRGVGRSRVIKISVRSESPKKAAAIANKFAEFYIVAQLEAKFEATQRANAWLGERLTELRQKVDSSERAIEAFRQ